MAKDLTKRRLEILKAIHDYTRTYRRPPTMREIEEAVELHSPGATSYQVDKLINAGYLERVGDGARNLKLSMKGIRTLAHARLSGRVEEDSIPEEASVVRIPLMGYIHAGAPIPAPGSGMVDENPFSDEVVTVPLDFIGRTDNLFALRVKGDSMIDALVGDGDYVIVRQQASAESGDMVAVWLEDEESTTLKYFYPRSGGQEIELRPANPTYHSLIKPGRVVKISGKVVAVIRSLEE